MKTLNTITVCKSLLAVISAFGFSRDLLDWAAEVIKKLFRRVNHDHNWELSLRLDERRRERERIAR
jgi:hypothetical protein